MSAGACLRQLLQTAYPVALPGAFNGLVARMCVDTGFQGIYISGAAVSASMGIPDIGIVNCTEFCKVVKEITSVSGLPCIADADTGFGDGEAVARTVWEYHSAGAAGMHIEDQICKKICGHLQGKKLVDIDTMTEKISQAVKASKKCSNGEFIICARTDATAVEGLSSAIERAKAYVGAGADMIFPEGLESEEDFAKFAKEMKLLQGSAPNGGPFLLANMTEFGKTPIIPLRNFGSLGYHCVIFPVSTLRAAMKPVLKMLSELKAMGTVSSTLSEMYTRKELYETLRYTPGKAWVFPAINRE